MWWVQYNNLTCEITFQKGQFSFVATVRNHREQAARGNKTVLIERGFASGPAHVCLKGTR